ncbi:Pentatricopeptide repeat-containing protein [Thalictrum thalictroides]|uniref:Pentatricopeptide repeat-containing protein n=1 Tax=Thalictrum thalictroides TaxID=46969 RepID=A0A7J6X4A6_THATH|nr:Pentatricopeptide repeat-containing protein [Thalictrum thalictroides]
MIKGYSCCGSFKESLAFYVEMRCRGVFPNNFNIPFALKSCAALKALSETLQIHSDVVKLGFVSNVFVQTALSDTYVKCGRMEFAKKVFDDMSVKNVVSWTVIIDGYCRLGMLDQAKKMFHEMPIRNIVTWNVMIDGLTRFGDLETAQWYFDHMPERSIKSWTILIGGYSRAGSVDKARLLFDQMLEREVVAWTAMITCYVDNGKPEEAIKLFHEMVEANLKLDAVTMLTIISAVSQLGSLHLCAWIDNCVTERGFRFDLRIQNAIINMYLQCGSNEKAFKIFEKMPTRDVISYNSMITGYATHGDANQAFSLFSMMNKENVLPSSITFIGLLSACAHRGLVEEGRRYFRSMLDLCYVEVKSEHYACMVDLLGRAGYLEEAHNLILGMPIKPSASTWGALLGACRIHGNIVLAEVVAQRLFQMEPENPGNYAVLANVYADKRMWNSAANVRRVMEEKSLYKTPGSSWAEKYNSSEPVSYPISL